MLAGAAQPLDIDDAFVRFIQGAFTEIDAVDRHPFVHQMQQVLGEPGVPAMGNDLAQFCVKRRVLRLAGRGRGPLCVEIGHR